jgi:cell wall-associated NlpC family hydrolase
MPWRTVLRVARVTGTQKQAMSRFLLWFAVCLLVTSLPAGLVLAEPREPVGDTATVTTTTDGPASTEDDAPDAPQETAAVIEGLPNVVGELLDLRLAAQEAVTEAEIARTVAERARVSARAAHFTATVARLRARHARAVLERWAAGLFRNEVGVHAYVDIMETGIMYPERTLDVAHWLGLVGKQRENGIAEAARLVDRAGALEQIAFDGLAKAEQAEEHASIRRGQADIILASTETALRAAVGDDFKHQLTIGPDGCPTTAPTNSIRAGLPEDVARLCARSVALASTPEAALAIKYAFRALGATYACEGSGRNLPMRYDCSSLVARAYAEGAGLLTATATWIPTTRNLLPWDGATQAAWARDIEPDEALPGDLVLYDTERISSRHVVMLLADGYMLHIAECGDISHVTGFWGYADGNGFQYLGTRRVDPMIARDPASVLDGTDPWLTDGVLTELESTLDGDATLPPVTGEPDTVSTDEGSWAAATNTGAAGIPGDAGTTVSPGTGTDGAERRVDRRALLPIRDYEAERMMGRYKDLTGVR